MITRQLKPGDKVTYLAHPGAKYERGIVKSLHPTDHQRVFVVYKCNNQWDRYQEFTAACTDISGLEHGWL